jgi:hypothetical protein
VTSPPMTRLVSNCSSHTLIPPARAGDHRTSSLTGFGDDSHHWIQTIRSTMGGAPTEARVDRFNELNAIFRSIVDSLYGEFIESGKRENAFEVEDADEAAKIVRATVEGLFLQWLQEVGWKELHPVYKDICTSAILTYLGKGSGRR